MVTIVKEIQKRLYMNLSSYNYCFTYLLFVSDNEKWNIEHNDIVYSLHTGCAASMRVF